MSLLVVVDGSSKSQGLVIEQDLVRNDALMIYILVRWQVIVRYIRVINMSDKKEIQEPGLDPEEAKELELNEQPKPTRKISHPATPIPDNAEPSTNDKIKGRRTIK
jgi:hypothetical protein